MTSKSKPITIAVIGAGVMGRGIVQWATTVSQKILLFDEQLEVAIDAKNAIATRLLNSVNKNRIAAEHREQALSKIEIASDIHDIAPASVVIEAIAEDNQAKQNLFRELEEIVGQETILCTNTSSLSITEIASSCQNPDRVAGLHFFNPVPMMKVVEVISGEHTAKAVVIKLCNLIYKTEHHPIVCADSPGFVINHAGRALITEGLRIEQERIASPADIDRIVRDSLGLRMGPFELLDLTGLDISGRVLQQIYDGFQQEPRYRPTPKIQRRIAANKLGRKSGSGFYEYRDSRKVEPEEPTVKAISGAKYALFGNSTAHSEIAACLERAHSKSVPLDKADFVLLTPLGSDATSAVLRTQIEPQRAIAVDTLFPKCFEAGGRVTLMKTPATSQDAVDCAHGAFLSAGQKVTTIADSSGFVAQRIAASIINTACEIAQLGLASSKDIDLGVTLGLGYPIGPLQLGDVLGAQKVLAVLTALHEQTLDARYRPSQFLRRRALLGLPLSAGFQDNSE
ncbi:MAG: 3-hydroxyacyl-CoA dehydrogenase [Aestuariivita sp.]|nr:3-hydroxyacyl-CoA dehydrogenase [Aestuariivita sp.]MCY4345678.1 3-hydroxyacyl-CoA dehydrogenase [Aestuariivita sp.]